MTHRVRRVLTLAGAILVVVMLLGATYQGVATAFERRQYQHPGHMVKAGRHQLHIYCTGEGTPTVVLESGATGMSAAWGWVQPEIARKTRVCSYDRAGLGWSEWGQVTFEPDAVPTQLRTLLGNAGERGPYIMAGEGLGAAFARMYASDFPNETAALVLIDPPEPIDAPAQLRQIGRMANLSPWLARIGALRAARSLSAHSNGLPGESAGRLATFLNRPDHLTRAGRELARWNDTLELAAKAAPRPELPMTTVKAAGADPVALLTDRTAAEQATKAIDAMVDRLRRQP